MKHLLSNTKTYKIDRNNGEPSKTVVGSLKDALQISRQWLGVARVYQGAEYVTDAPSVGDERIPVDALDIWTTRSAAMRENGAPADIVISWGY